MDGWVGGCACFYAKLSRMYCLWGDRGVGVGRVGGWVGGGVCLFYAKWS